MIEILQKRTACNRDCPDACGVIATVENGRITRIGGDRDHPVTQGFLCERTSRYLDRQYSPDRLTTPLIRRGDQLHTADWDEALDLIAERMLHFRETSGPASILQYRSGGSLGMMKHVDDYFFQRFGPVTVKSGDVCAGAAEAAQLKDFGHFDSGDLLDLKNSRTILLWGKNVYTSSVHLIPLLKQARRRGTRIVLIDPVSHRTRDLCDRFVQPRAGGDASLAMGMARWLLDNDAADDSAASYCDHYDAYCELVRSRTVDDWARIADVSAADLVALAEQYARGPASIQVGWGMQRRRHGAATIRAIDALCAVSGNLGVSGGGVSFYFARRGAFDLSFSKPEDAPRRIPEPLLGPGILAAADPPIRMVWVSAGNPVVMLPESKTVQQALRSRELTVVVDAFLTDTARTADVVLPTTTMLEENDLLGAFGHHWLIESRPVVAPPAGVKTDYEIIQALAGRVGLAEEFSGDVGHWKERLLRRVAQRGIERRDFENGPVKNPFTEPVIFGDRRFPTPSGRVNLISSLAEELLQPTGADTLRLAALSTPKSQGSQWPAQTQVGPATATVHPAAARGFADGQIVRLVSETGSIEVRLQFDTSQRADVVLMDKGGWHSAGRCANSLIKAELSDDGQCAVYYDTPVRIVARDETSQA